VSALPDPLPLEDTTPVTEAVENSFDEAARSLRDISHELQSAISIASNPKKGAYEEFIVQTSRLGRALLLGCASAWSSAVDGLGLIAADEVGWWWTAQLELPFAKKHRHGVVRASVATIPQGETIPSQWVRVARARGNGNVDLIDRGAGVPPNWNGKCFVSVRQYGAFTPGAVLISFRMVNASGHTIVETKPPINAVLSL
jgi:hypothetical protein